MRVDEYLWRPPRQRARPSRHCTRRPRARPTCARPRATRSPGSSTRTRSAARPTLTGPLPASAAGPTSAPLSGGPSSAPHSSSRNCCERPWAAASHMLPTQRLDTAVTDCHQLSPVGTHGSLRTLCACRLIRKLAQRTERTVRTVRTDRTDRTDCTNCAARRLARQWAGSTARRHGKRLLEAFLRAAPAFPRRDDSRDEIERVRQSAEPDYRVVRPASVALLRCSALGHARARTR